MVDLLMVALLASSAFFVVLSLGLLFRYRQVSAQISSSNDLGHDLWEALESRLKKQDERILDVMGRVEVIQSRVIEKQIGSPEDLIGSVASIATAGKKPSTSQRAAALLGARESQKIAAQVTSQPVAVSLDPGDEIRWSFESRLNKQEDRLLKMMNQLEAVQSSLTGEHMSVSPVVARRLTSASEARAVRGGSIERSILGMLGERARTSVEIRQQFNVSREHAARSLKGLFDRGLVVRDNSHKPFVYELTDAGRRYLSTN